MTWVHGAILQYFHEGEMQRITEKEMRKLDHLGLKVNDDLDIVNRSVNNESDSFLKTHIFHLWTEPSEHLREHLLAGRLKHHFTPKIRCIHENAPPSTISKPVRSEDGRSLDSTSIQLPAEAYDFKVQR